MKTSHFIFPASDGSHSVVFKVTSSGVVSYLKVSYDFTGGNMANTAAFSSTDGTTFSSGATLPFTFSESTVKFGDYMSLKFLPHFALEIPDTATLDLVLFDGSVISGFSITSPLNLFDGRSTNSVMEITPIDLSDLGGNFSKYVQGDRVFYGTYGIWEVLKSTLMLVSEDTFMPMYQLRQNIADDGQPVKYRYNVAPQNVLTLYVPPKSLTVGG